MHLLNNMQVWGPGVNLFSFVVQDGLLAQGNQDLILRIFNKIPKMSPDGKRLQVNCSKEVYERVLRILVWDKASPTKWLASLNCCRIKFEKGYWIFLITRFHSHAQSARLCLAGGSRLFRKQRIVWKNLVLVDRNGKNCTQLYGPPWFESSVAHLVSKLL